MLYIDNWRMNLHRFINVAFLFNWKLNKFLQVLEYEYEPEMEDTYRSSMLKTFKKTLEDGFFPFIIIDTINDRVKHFDQFWSAAKTKGFEVSLFSFSFCLFEFSFQVLLFNLLRRISPPIVLGVFG